MQRDIQPYVKLKDYTDFSSAIDLKAEHPLGECARCILVTAAGSGSVEVQFEDGSTLTVTGLAAGDYLEPYPTHFARILDGTNVAGVRVGF